jgi:hypothetical protein
VLADVYASRGREALDLAGHLLLQTGWNHLNLPAIALEDQTIELGGGKKLMRRSGDILRPEREGRDALEAIKSEVGSLLFSAQYQQQPVPAEGNIIRRSWFPTYETLPTELSPTRTVQSWDVAMRQATAMIIRYARHGLSTEAMPISCTYIEAGSTIQNCAERSSPWPRNMARQPF